MSSIITFTATDNVCCNVGDRIPTVLYKDGQITACTAIDNNGNRCSKSRPNRVKVDSWTTILIKQYPEGSSHRFEMRLNGSRVFSILNNKAREFTNVKVYVSDPNYYATPGIINNLLIRYNEGKIFSF